jgi:probable tail fiber protein (fragment)|nr:MAG TPA: Baseplate structural protein [Caudoviricetes sp.]
MAIHNKPDESVFASSARPGEVSNFPDIGRGWGVSFDQTGGIPPMEWFNFLFKRTDEKFGYLFQRGLSEWSATQEYPIGALVQYKNLTYKAKRANTNKNPEQADSLDWQRWGFTQSELKNATLTESGIVQLLTSTNSDDETKSATPKSVKMAYDKGVEAKTAADNANNNANNRVPFSQMGRNYAKIITNHDGYGGYEIENNILNYTFRFESENDHMKFWSNIGGNSYAIHFPARRNGEVALIEDVNKKVSKDGDEVKWLGIKRDHAWMYITSTGYPTAGLDFTSQNGRYPQVSLEAVDIGEFGDELRIHTTPKGQNYETDRRNHVMTVAHDGNVWVKPYGWLHDYFAKQADINNVWNDLNNTYRKNRFRHQNYPNHYNGAEVFDIPVADNGVVRLIIMNVSINGYARVNLPEAYNGNCIVQATDLGAGRKAVGANIQSGNVVEIHNGGETNLQLLTIGWYGW